MLDGSGSDDALGQLAASGRLRDPRQVPPEELGRLRARGVVSALEGKISVEGRDIAVSIGIGASFPLSLPVITLRPADALGLIPHVEIDGDGYVCYNQPEGLLLDSSNPIGILEGALDRAAAVLRAGVNGDNHLDFVDELAAYWQRVAPKAVIRSFLRVDDVLREVDIYRSGQDSDLVADDLSDVREYYGGNDRALGSLKRRAGLYVPLTKGTAVVPPRKGKLWSLTTVKALVAENLTEANRMELRKLGRRYRSEELVVLAVPRPRGSATLIALSFKGITGGHPLLDGRIRTGPVPLRVDRYDRDYLLPRSGGQLALQDWRILVVGCGAVGGHVALSLARAGVGRLGLVDPDYMKLVNTYRHVLGRSSIGDPKVDALRKEITSKYPYVSVTTYVMDVERAIADGKLDLADYDLGIFASGNPTVELHMNRLLHGLRDGPKAVYAWLEPYGIGGHALLARPGIPGCFQCLYCSPWENHAPLYNWASFASKDQFFGADDLGCGTFYTAYASLDAERTAEQAVSLALDGLTGREMGSPLLSWKGPGDAFTAAGFKLSDRYQLDQSELYQRRFAYTSARCPVCGGSKE